MNTSFKVRRSVSSVRNALTGLIGLRDLANSPSTPDTVRQFAADQIAQTFEAIRAHDLGPATAQKLNQFEQNPDTLNPDTIEQFVRSWGEGR